MQRIIAFFRQKSVSLYCIYHVGRFYGYYYIVKAVFFKQSDMLERALAHSLSKRHTFVFFIE